MVKVAFIDDGISRTHVPCDIHFENYIVDDGAIKANTPITHNSHGTACYSVFCNSIQSKYKLVSLKIVNTKTYTGNIYDLQAALKWCGKHEVNLIHMSIGLQQMDDISTLYNIMKDLSDSGVIIVAACNNQNTVTFPACFPMVIGVRHYDDEALMDTFIFHTTPFDQIEIITCAKDVVLLESEDVFNLWDAGSSLAVPFITAKICTFLENGCKGLDEVRQKLKTDSIKGNFYSSFLFYKSLFQEWKDIDVPIVVFCDESFESLIGLFIFNGYNAVGLSKTKDTDICKYIYKFLNNDCSITEAMQLYHNFLLPDIIFLDADIDIAEIRPLVDILVADSCKWNILGENMVCLDINEPDINLYQKIHDTLT